MFNQYFSRILIIKCKYFYISNDQVIEQVEQLNKFNLEESVTSKNPTIVRQFINNIYINTLDIAPKFKIIDPVSYIEMLELINNSKYVITDSIYKLFATNFPTSGKSIALCTKILTSSFVGHPVQSICKVCNLFRLNLLCD